MKTLTINTTSYKSEEDLKNNALIETHYAYNGEFGIESSTYKMDESIECKVYVSTMFPGTHEEWSRHIASIIEQSVIEMVDTYTNDFDQQVIDFSKIK